MMKLSKTWEQYKKEITALTPEEIQEIEKEAEKESKRILKERNEEG